VNERLFDVDPFGYGNPFCDKEQASGEVKASPLIGVILVYTEEIAAFK
jgi:hypothetical protein